MLDNLSATTYAIVALVVAVLGYRHYKGKMKLIPGGQKVNKNTGAVLLVIGVLMGLAVTGNATGLTSNVPFFDKIAPTAILSAGDIPGVDSGDDQQIDFREGVAATATLNAYDSEANTLTEVYPLYWILNQDGQKLVDGLNANTTAAVKDDDLTIYIGGTGFYGASAGEEKNVHNEAPVFSLEAHTAAAESSLTMQAYDSDNIQLTAKGNVTTGDYNLSMGADQTEIIWLKITNGDDNSVHRLGAICTGYAFNTTGTSVFKVDDSEWTEVPVPKQARTAALSIPVQGGTSFTATGYDNCYVPKAGFIDLNEWGELKVKTLATSASTAPVGASGNFIVAQAFDVSWEDGKDGKIYFDWYKHDDDQQPSAVGIDETETSPQGGTSGLAIEMI